MSLFQFIQRSIRYYWRTSIGICLAMAVSCAVLVGALTVGDSVRYSLKRLVDIRLGQVEYAVISQDKFFTAKLANSIASKTQAEIAAVIQLRGIASNDDGAKRVNQVNVLGVDEHFFKL